MNSFQRNGNKILGDLNLKLEMIIMNFDHGPGGPTTVAGWYWAGVFSFLVLSENERERRR